MIKVFTLNKNKKIELTKDELEKLLDDSYWEGYRANNGTYVYHSPNWWKPYEVTYCTTAVGNSADQNKVQITLNGTASDSISVSADDINLKGTLRSEI